MLFSLGVLAALLPISGHFRPGAFVALITHPRYALELALGNLSSFVAAYVAFEMVVPGRIWTRWQKVLSVAPFLGFVGLVLYSVWVPALPPSWQGWRPGCEMQILLLGAFPMVLLFVLAKRALPLEQHWTGFLIGIASMSAPAASMHLGCMYQPWHILFWHILPVLLMALLGLVVGPRFFCNLSCNLSVASFVASDSSDYTRGH